MKINSHDYSSIHKVGKYEFLANVHFLPSLTDKNLVSISVELTNTNASSSFWKRSVTISESDIHCIIYSLIDRYFAEIDYFRITHS
jgi:hypothetical protein